MLSGTVCVSSELSSDASCVCVYVREKRAVRKRQSEGGKGGGRRESASRRDSKGRRKAGREGSQLHGLTCCGRGGGGRGREGEERRR